MLTASNRKKKNPFPHKSHFHMAERSGLKQLSGMPLKHFNCWQANLIPYQSGRGHGQTDNQQRKKCFCFGAQHVQCLTNFSSSWKWSNLIFRISFITFYSTSNKECSSKNCCQYLQNKETLPPSSKFRLNLSHFSIYRQP